MKTEGLSQETLLVLENLQKEIKPLERQIVNSSYDQGYTDKERGKKPVWDQHASKYNNYFKTDAFGK